MEEITRIITANPRHVLMPSMIELADAEVTDVGRWNPAMCRVCRGSRRYVGYKPGSTTEFDTYVCPCEEQLTLRRWFAVRGIPDTGMQIRRADMTGVPPDWISTADSFLARLDANLRLGQSLMFHGRSGSGKSSLAWLVMKAVLWNGYSGFAVNAYSLLDKLYKWRDDQGFLDRWNRHVYGSDLLVIDDLGKESGGKTDNVNRSVDGIIVRRAEDRRSTIITTNLTREQLTQRYPEAMDSMIGAGTLIEMSLAENWRSTDLRERNAFEVAHNISRPAVWG